MSGSSVPITAFDEWWESLSVMPWDGDKALVEMAFEAGWMAAVKARDTGSAPRDAEESAFLTLSLEEASQIFQAIVEAQSYLAAGRKPNAWDSSKGYVGKPIPELTAARSLLGRRLFP